MAHYLCALRFLPDNMTVLDPQGVDPCSKPTWHQVKVVKSFFFLQFRSDSLHWKKLAFKCICHSKHKLYIKIFLNHCSRCLEWGPVTWSKLFCDKIVKVIPKICAKWSRLLRNWRWIQRNEHICTCFCRRVYIYRVQHTLLIYIYI